MCNIATSIALNPYKNIMQRKEKILLVYNINNACICELSKAMCNIVKFNAVLCLYLLIVINWLI